MDMLHFIYPFSNGWTLGCSRRGLREKWDPFSPQVPFPFPRTPKGCFDYLAAKGPLKDEVQELKKARTALFA